MSSMARSETIKNSSNLVILNDMVTGLLLINHNVSFKALYASSNWPAMNEYENMIGKLEGIAMTESSSSYFGSEVRDSFQSLDECIDECGNQKNDRELSLLLSSISLLRALLLATVS